MNQDKLKLDKHGSMRGLGLLGFIVIGLLLVGVTGAAAQKKSAPAKVAAPATVSFERDIFPILHENCIGCHSAATKMGGFVLESFDEMMKGGTHGPAILPGKSNESRLVLMLEGRIQPRMPMTGALKPAQIAAIKAWIDAGALLAAPASAPAVSANAPKPVIPDIKPKGPVVIPVNALAYAPDGKHLAASGYKEVQLLDAARGQTTTTLRGPSDMVRALAYSPDGKYLAAAGGPPGQLGEVVIWETGSSRLVHTLKGHNDYIYTVAFSPNGRLLATASYDRLIKLWDVASGAELKTLKDHIDAVYPIAFSPDGKLLASGAADRSVKVWEVASGRRLFTLSESTDAVYALAFHPAGKQLVAAGADKVIRVWTLTAEGGALTSSVIAHEGEINRLAYTPDGNWLVSAGSDGLIKIWDGATMRELKVLAKQPDWIQALAISPDGEHLAVSVHAGTVKVYELKTGQPVMMPLGGKERPQLKARQ